MRLAASRLAAVGGGCPSEAVLGGSRSGGGGSGSSRLEIVRAKEAKMLQAVRGGLKEPSFIAELLTSDRVRYVDE